MSTLDQFQLAGKVALVTGGSQGLGLGIATALAEAGADVAIAARREDRLADAREKLAQTGRRVLTISADLSDMTVAQDIVAQTVAEFGRLDILVANAGTTVRKAALDISPEEWDSVISVNLDSVFFSAQAAARQFIAQGVESNGKIITLASLNTKVSMAGIAPYVASKGAIGQLTMGLAVEWAQYNINVNGIGPGIFPTEINEHVVRARQDEFNRRIPFHRTGTPADLAGAAVFLASPASDYVTGHVLYVDGGYLAN